MNAQELLAAARSDDTQLGAVLQQHYGSDPELHATALARVAALAQRHGERYGADAPVRVVRAPGRVNLIGEHTDYNGLPVMPMAISRDVMVAVSPADDMTIAVTNTDRSFADCTFALERSIAPFETGYWGNYVKTAAQGLIDYYGSADALRGARLTVDGNVPIASGLSSSAAFTIAGALALLVTAGKKIDPVTFAELMAQSDHYLGMASGGMDQAASVLGQARNALKIDFFPLRVHPVRLPGNTEIVVCHSRVTAAKAGSARDAYNRRTVECRLATAVLHRLGPWSTAEEPRLLSEWLERETDDFPEALATIQSLLQPTGYTLDELCRILAASPEAVLERYCTTKVGTQYGQPDDGYQLQRRARHVISEAQRVEQSFALLDAGDTDAAQGFGSLMNESHESCRDDYEISCPELDALVSAARNAGAYGARLTGAGFGGCTVNLIPVGGAQQFKDMLDAAYYVPRDLTRCGENQYEFAPASGAGVVV